VPFTVKDSFDTAERSLVKTYGPRGTVHLLPAEDLSLWTGALGAIPPPAAIRDRFLTPGQTDEVIVAIARSLRTDELTAAELSEAVVARTGPWADELVIPAFSGMWPRWRRPHSVALCVSGKKGAAGSPTRPYSTASFVFGRGTVQAKDATRQVGFCG
jgi:hypothetical protein